MWLSLLALCLASLIFPSAADGQQRDDWVWWLLPDTDSADNSQSRGGHGAGSGSSTSPWKRTGPSLSIVNPLDVLRQRLQLETARRRQVENEQRIRENELLLRNLGKRSWNI